MPESTQLNTLVIGVSDNPKRYAYKALNSLKSKQYPVWGIGKKATCINGVDVFDLNHSPTFPPIHTVTMYVSPELQHLYWPLIQKLKPKRVIFNPGTENPVLEADLTALNIPFEKACTLILLQTNQYEPNL